MWGILPTNVRSYTRSTSSRSDDSLSRPGLIPLLAVKSIYFLINLTCGFLFFLPASAGKAGKRVTRGLVLVVVVVLLVTHLLLKHVKSRYSVWKHIKAFESI